MRLRLLLLSLLVTLVGVAAPAAQAAGTPNISLDKNAPASVLFGEDSTVTLTASNPSGPTTGYNLSFRDVLPAGVSYVAGSAAVAPRVLPNAPGAGQTTLLFENVSDLSGGSSYSLSYQVRHSTTTYTVGSSYTNNAGAYVNSDPRFLPKFTATGTPIGPAADSHTGFATDSAVTQIAAIEILKSEPSPEGELLRGAHDHQTVYTLSVRNNGVQPTTNLVVDDYLPAGLEFLGCGTADNTTDAPSNPGQTDEYLGSGPLNPGNAPLAPGCIAPTLVETLLTDPDGGGPRPLAVYTHVRFTPAAGTLTPGQTITLRYVAAIPIRENTTAWPGGMTPTPAAGTQASNLDNNSGGETSDEQALTNYARAGGNYNGTLPVSDDVNLTRTAEDLAIHKSVDDASIAQGDVSTWRLDIETSEYRYVDDLRVTDVVPDGLCPLGDANLEAAPQSAECGPSGDEPSAAYTDVTEHPGGTWTLEWDQSTVPELGRMDPSSTFTITFPTRTRAFYQEGFVDADPVLTRDSWVNSVSIVGADFVICAPADPDCTGVGAEIDADETGGSDDVDESSAGQTAGGVTIDKQVGAAHASPMDCETGTSYIDGPPPLYGPGDRVCWTVRVDFAGSLDSGMPRVTDFLPPGTVYEAGSAEATANNEISSSFDDSQSELLTWDLGSTVDSGALVFEWRFSTIVTKDSASTSGDVPGNLMKFAYANSAGTTFPLRDQADFEREEAELSLLKGVRDVNDAPAGGFPANTDNVEVQGGDTVTYRVDIANDGGRDAEAIEVWDDLPAGIDCSVVQNISDSGICTTLTDRIEWSGLTLGAGASDTLTYDLVIPTTVSPAQTLTNTAGVRSYRSDTNIGGSFLYIPESNIDPALTTPNAVRADDVSNVFTDPVTLVKARTTEITGPGNSAAEAAIGEEITYTLTATIPQGTTIYDSPTLTDVLSPRLTYMAGSATATLNGTGLPTGGLTLTASGSPTTIAVAFPSTYTNAAGSGDDVLVVTFKAKLADVISNFRTGASVPNSGTLAWDDQGGTARTVSSNVNTNVSEPVLSLAKDENDGDDAVDPGQIIHYIVTASNGSAVRTSTAHDLIAIDTLPLGVTPVNAGVPVADGGTVVPDGGIWNAAARTITWNVTSLAPGAGVALDYDVEIDDPAVVGTTFPNSATLTGTSLPDVTDDDGGERGPSSTRTTGYIAAANDVVRLGTASVTKTVSAPTATIGEERVFTVEAVIPGGVEFFDTTVIDTLPDGYDYDFTTSIITCLAPCVPGITGTVLPAEPQVGGETRLGWFLGDLAPAAADRTVRIVYRAHVDDSYAAPATPVVAANTLVNGVAVYANRTNDLGTPSTIPAAASFDESTPLATALTTVTEPALSLDKAVTDDAGNDDIRPTQPGDSYIYTVSVTNNGSSPAYDIEVSDQPDAELENVVLTTGSALVTSDGWTTGDPDIHWLIPGPIAPGATVILRYTADLVASAGLSQGQLVVNTADVDRYWGVSQAERTANGHDYREYTTVPSDTVTLVVDLPQLSVTKTTGASGNPDTANAEVGQAFPWRVVIANTSSAASALDIDVSDVLPPNWTYVAGSASFAPGGAVEPTVTAAPTGDTLAWPNVGDIAPGGQIVLTFSARPTLASATTPGSGVGNPHINTGTADAEDASGAGGSADGPYADSDTARAILLMPALAIAKTPDAGAATAGAISNFSVQVNNTGAGTARNVRVTDVLPPGAAYTAGAATAAPATGFSEASVTAGPGPGQTTIVWNIASIASGAGVAITVPVRPAASLADGTTLTNNASVLSDELPTPVSDTGSFVVSSSADVSILKTTPLQTSVTAGETIDYVLRAANAGPSDALGVVVSDVLPANVTWVSAEAPCTHSAGTVTCVLGTLAAGANRELDLRVRVLTGATGNVVNPAEVTSDTPDPDSSDNEDDVTTPIGTTADLWIDKSTVAPTVIQGDQITYDIAVTNDGPSDAAGVTVTDILPAGVSYVSATPDQGSCLQAAGTVTCALGAIAASMSARIELVVNADDDGTVLNEASVSSSTPDPDLMDNEDDAPVTVAPAADLAIVKTGDLTATAGGEANYSFTVTNNGPSDATGVEAADALPAGTTLVSSLPVGDCTAAGELVTCDVGDLSSGASETFDLVVAVPFALADQTLTNIAVVSGDQADTDSSNDGDSANTTVGPAADLTLEKTGGTATSGGTVTWTLVISNAGPSAATGVTLEDPLPPGLTFISATPSQGDCSEAGGTVSCALGTIASGASAQVTIVAGVPADLPVGTDVSNTATVGSEQPDPTPGDNTDRVITPVQPPPPTAPNLIVGKRASVERPRLGVPFTYFIDVGNAGPGPATNVKLTDTLSADVKLVSASIEGGGHCARQGQAISCSLGNLAAGGSARVRLRVRPLRTGRLDNTASAAADESDLDESDNRDTARVRVRAPKAAYSLTKRANRAAVAGGDIVRFNIVVRMRKGAGSGVRICDRLPDGLVFVRARGATFRSGQACWRRTYMASGSVLRLKVVTRAQRGFAFRRVTNTAIVTGRNLARRTDSAPVAISPAYGGAPSGVTG